MATRYISKYAAISLLVNMSTGEPSLVSPGQPLNCRVGPATNTHTTCFLFVCVRVCVRACMCVCVCVCVWRSGRRCTVYTCASSNTVIIILVCYYYLGLLVWIPHWIFSIIGGLYFRSLVSVNHVLFPTQFRTKLSVKSLLAFSIHEMELLLTVQGAKFHSFGDSPKRFQKGYPCKGFITQKTMVQVLSPYLLPTPY